MTKSKTTTDSDKKIEAQNITLSTIIGKIIEAIIVYITIYFFKPVWEKMVSFWKRKDDDSNS